MNEGLISELDILIIELANILPTFRQILFLLSLIQPPFKPLYSLEQV